MQVLSRISLMIIFLYVALVELLTNRIVVHFMDQELRRTSIYYRSLDNLGLFSFYLTAFLGLGILSWAIVVLISDSKLIRIPNRVLLMLSAAAFIPLAAAGAIFQLPPHLAPYLNFCFGLLVVMVVVSALTRPLNIRYKLGILYLAIPLMLHAYWLATRQIPLLAFEGYYAYLPAKFLDIAEHLVIVGAFAAFLFFAPIPRFSALLDIVPVSITMSLTVAMGVFVTKDNHVAARLFRVAFGLNLPTSSSGELLQLTLYIVAFFFFTLLVTTLALRKGHQRGLAIGLLLLALSGFQLELPYQFLLALIGLVQIFRTTLAIDEEEKAEASAQLPTLSDWKVLLPQAFDTYIDERPEIVGVQSDQKQIVKLRAPLAKEKTALLNLRIEYILKQWTNFSFSFGEYPENESAPIRFSIKKNTQEFCDLHINEDVVDAEYREALKAFEGDDGDLIGGDLAIWPEEGLFFQANLEKSKKLVDLKNLVEAKDNDERLNTLLRFLISLADTMNILKEKE